MKFIKILIIVSTVLCSINNYGQEKGKLTGKITEKSTSNLPLPSVNVVIKRMKIATNSNEFGQYTINIPAGEYTVQYSFVGFETIEKSIKIIAGESQTVDVSLAPSSNNLQDVVVKSSSTNREKETALLMDQKKAVEIKQSIGAQEMSRKGISDVEEGLTKITGITKVEGRGLFVRGLEDRYNNLLVNGLAVPSNNPFKKIIPLDLFPTDIVGVLDTYKTFNSNLYGDFAGATFDIQTSKGGKSQTKINFGAGYTTNNNLEKFLISKDANSTGDFFGFSGSERNLPASLGKAPKNSTMTSNESLSQFGSGFDVEETKSPLNTSFGILHAEKFNIGKNENSLNYLFSLNFDNKYSFEQGVDRFFSNVGAYENNLINTKYRYTTNTSVLLALNYKSKRLNITSNSFYLKTVENMIQDQLGSTNGTAVINENSLIRLNQLLETSYLNTQLLANYKITEDDKHSIKAGGSFTKTEFGMPDRKSFKSSKIDENTAQINYSGNSLYRQYFDIKGKFHASGLMEYNYKFGNEDLSKANKLSIGYNGYGSRFESVIRFLISNGTTPSVFNTNTPDSVFNANIASGNLTYNEGSNSQYKTIFEEATNAGYFDLALKFGEQFDLNIGCRFENFNRKIRYRDSGPFDAPYKSIIRKELNFLPSLNAKYKTSEKSNLRLAASRTNTKPVMMEILPIEFPSPDGILLQGNAGIINSTNYNFDLKYELFPTNKELIAISGFGKYIENPIERLFTPSAGSGGQIITYDNSKKAVIVGAELELLYQLDRISKSLSDFSFGFNTSLMYTKVNIDKAIETVFTQENQSRNLQGASPWLINADLKYEFDMSQNWKNTLSMVYNVYGERIFAVGTINLDHYYEKSFHKLDLVLNSKFNKNWEAKFAIDNILNPYYKIKLGENINKTQINETDVTIKQFKRGVGFSFNLAYSF